MERKENSGDLNQLEIVKRANSRINMAYTVGAVALAGVGGVSNNPAFTAEMISYLTVGKLMLDGAVAKW